MTLPPALRAIHDALGAAVVLLHPLERAVREGDVVEIAHAARALAREASLAAEGALRLANETGSRCASVQAERCVEQQVAAGLAAKGGS